MWYIPILEKLLTEYDAELLRSIRAPRVVAVQPEDSCRGFCVMPDGEIRHYGLSGKKDAFVEDGERVYIASRDCGLSWKTFPADQNALGASARLPWSNRYATLARGKDGTYAMWSDDGPDDSAPHRFKISDYDYFDMFQPVPLVSRRRLLVAMQRRDETGNIPACAISDDDGESWRIVELAQAPRFEIVWPHEGLRWENNGADPVLSELPDGRLQMLIRTSQDFFYESFSEDGGDTWSICAPSRFHGTLTNSFLLRLRDGRTVVFWNNTQPLPEIDKTKAWPPIEETAVDGTSEDVFTNRDVAHAAIRCADGEYRGFRELFLNPIRGASDFRSNGGELSSADKSVHQFQAIELPYNKIHVAVGQHESSRRILIFDADWLLETSRKESFRSGLCNVSTHSYVKSVSGSRIGDGYPGHCAWNRTDGPLLVPDPDGAGGEALQLCRIRDPRLVSERQGVVWNFPAARAGTLKLSLRVEGSDVRISLCDRWFNPTDDTVMSFASFAFKLGASCVSNGEWHDVRVSFDLDAARAEVFCEDKKLFSVRLTNQSENGLSYLCIQSDAEEPDSCGSYLRGMEFVAK